MKTHCIASFMIMLLSLIPMQLSGESDIETKHLPATNNDTEEDSIDELDDFLEHIGFRESTNNPDAINTLGYIGEYQFGRAALIDVGYSHVTAKRFAKDRSIFSEEDQRDAMIKLMKINEKRLRKYIARYEGSTMNGILITRSGLLAAAHLAGAGNVKKFLRSGGDYQFADAYGTSISKYLEELQGYNFTLNKY